MTYVIKAVIASKSDFEHFKRQALVRVVELPQSYCMIPLTWELLRSIYDQSDSDSYIPGFMYLKESIVAWLAKGFYFGTFALLENDTFGGLGEQSSLVWKDGKYVFGPIHTETNVCQPYTDLNVALVDAAMNQALRVLGVTKETDDEFHALGLGKYKDTEKWVV